MSSSSKEHYLTADGDRIIRAIRWFALFTGWAGLVIDKIPEDGPPDSMAVIVHKRCAPSAGHALARIVTGLPSFLVLSIFLALGVLVWLWSAVAVLINKRISSLAFRYMEGLQRWSVRLLCYQAGLVCEYPPFSFADVRQHGHRNRDSMTHRDQLDAKL